MNYFKIFVPYIPMIINSFICPILVAYATTVLTHRIKNFDRQHYQEKGAPSIYLSQTGDKGLIKRASKNIPTKAATYFREIIIENTIEDETFEKQQISSKYRDSIQINIEKTNVKTYEKINSNYQIFVILSNNDVHFKLIKMILRAKNGMRRSISDLPEEITLLEPASKHIYYFISPDFTLDQIEMRVGDYRIKYDIRKGINQGKFCK